MSGCADPRGALLCMGQGFGHDGSPPRCHTDSAKLGLIGRLQSPAGYTRTPDGFKLQQLDLARWQAQQAAPPAP